MAKTYEPAERFDDVGGRPFTQRFGVGLRLTLSGVSWAFGRRELRLWSALTVLLNVAIYVGLLALGLSYLDDATAWLGPDPAKWEGFWQGFMELVQGIIKLVLGITWVLASVFVALGVGNVVSGPLFDVISERAEEIVLGRSLAPPFSLVGMVRTAVRELFVQLGLLAIYLPVVLCILLIGLIPVVGQILAPLLTWLWTALWVTMTFTTQATARHGLGVSARLALIRRNKALGTGFGALQSLVPFLLIPLFAPGLVVGGTRLFLALAAHDRVPSKLTEADKALLRQSSDRALALSR